MGKLEESLQFLDKDLDKAEKQWEEEKQWMSILQREGKSFQDMWDLFDPTEDENEWASEYNGKKNAPKMQNLRKRMSFLKASRKEIKEEYEDKITDCDFMRLLELPYTDPRFVIEFGLYEMKK